MWLIGTLEQCQAYLQKVNKGEKYKENTITWGDIKKHPTLELSAIKKCTSPRNYEPDHEMQQVKVLPDEFIPKDIGD